MPEIVDIAVNQYTDVPDLLGVSDRPARKRVNCRHMNTLQQFWAAEGTQAFNERLLQVGGERRDENSRAVGAGCFR